MKEEFQEILNNVPDYKEFLTVDELDESSRKLAEQYDSVDLLEIGKSDKGKPILCLKIGNGKKNALLFAFPHPNEPIGSMTIEFLSNYLPKNSGFLEELDYTWYFIKAIDIEGAILNEGWFKGEFTPLKYARSFYRPPGHEQIEWTFPIEYKKLKFDSPPPETRALMKIIDKVKPDFMFSLHNAGFCGVYWYVSHDIKEMYPEFIKLVEDQELPIHRGEPETPYIKEYHPAVFKLFGIQEAYDFYKANGVENPQELIKSGTSSDDYLKRMTYNKGYTLVCEMPYFYDKALDDDSPSEYDRRKKLLEMYDFYIEVFQYAKERFELIRELCDPSSRIFTTTIDYIDNFEKRIEPRIHFTKTSDKYEGKATVAQAFDSMVASRYYSSLRLAMISRLCEEVIKSHPEKNEEISIIKSEIDSKVEKIVEEVLNNTEFEVIPIQKLVKVQVGSALIVMKYLKD